MSFEKRIESGHERLSYTEQLASILNIGEREQKELLAMYRAHPIPGVMPGNARQVLRNIRTFLSGRRTEIKDTFSDSLLGQSGCFPASVRTCFLAAADGIETHMARSRMPRRALHVLLLLPDGKPFDPTEAQKGPVVAMTLEQVKRYARFIQPIVTSTGRWRHELRKAKQARRTKRLNQAETPA